MEDNFMSEETIQIPDSKPPVMIDIVHPERVLLVIIVTGIVLYFIAKKSYVDYVNIKARSDAHKFNLLGNVATNIINALQSTTSNKQ